MAEVSTLPARQRTAIGKNQVARLREEGLVPVVVYGQGGESQHLALDVADLDRELRHLNRVFVIESEGKTQPVFLQDIQYDVLGDFPLHCDLLRIDLETPLSVLVELTFVGVPKGAARGGQVVRDIGRLACNCKPAMIPNEIQVKVTSLDLGDEILAKDVELPEGTELNCPESTRVCRMPL